jgi:hypothetical protein
MRVVGFALAGVVATVASFAIPSYVWCPGSREVHLSACCGDHEGTNVATPCCEPRSEEEIFARAGADQVRVFAPALVPIAVIVPPIATASIPSPVPDFHARAGPSERVHARLSIYLL